MRQQETRNSIDVKYAAYNQVSKSLFIGSGRIIDAIGHYHGFPETWEQAMAIASKRKVKPSRIFSALVNVFKNARS